MRTRAIKPAEAGIPLAAELLRAGELVAFPTETVYGLGADAMNDAAVRSIFAAKGRPADNPLIAHIDDMAMLDVLVAEPPPLAPALARAFWPGPLTLVMPASKRVPESVTAGLNTVAVRMPAHPVARALIAALGSPVAAPSANRSGRPSPTTAEHVLQDLGGRIPLILDGGACAVGLESTVLDITERTPVLLRPGGVTLEQLRAVAGDVRCAEGVMKPLREGEYARSPGLLHKHYAPRGALTLYRGEDAAVAARICAAYDSASARGLKCAILCGRERAPLYAGRSVRALGAEGGSSELTDVANDLFAALREMDDQGVEALFCESFREEGIGLAIMNRLRRAAAFRIEEA